jgi:hypothetical protein
VKEIDVPQLDPGRFEGMLEREPWRRFAAIGAVGRSAGWPTTVARELDRGGGGVAEMLHFSEET